MKPDKPSLSVGDHVRISKYKRKIFDKGYTPNWTEELFVVDKINPTKPITYSITDLMGEEIKSNSMQISSKVRQGSKNKNRSSLAY